MNFDKIKQYICNIEDHYKYPTHYEKSILFMLECLSHAKEKIPLQGKPSFEIALQFWVERNKQINLIPQRVECWKHVDAAISNTPANTAYISCIKSIICVLYAEPETDDIIEMLDWFIGLYLKWNADANIVFENLCKWFPIQQ